MNSLASPMIVAMETSIRRKVAMKDIRERIIIKKKESTQRLIQLTKETEIDDEVS